MANDDRTRTVDRSAALHPTRAAERPSTIEPVPDRFHTLDGSAQRAVRSAAVPGLVRVLVVDDSSVIRRLVTKALQRDPGIEVVATASTGLVALRKLALHPIDVVTLDLEMPELDGAGTLIQIRALYPRVRVIIFASPSNRPGSAASEQAALGADDFLLKPSQLDRRDDATERVASELNPRVRALGAGRQRSRRLETDTTLRAPATPATAGPATVGPASAAATALSSATSSPGAPVAASSLAPAVPVTARTPTPAPTPSGSLSVSSHVPISAPPRRGRPYQVLAIGSSTGGPNALHRVLADLPADFPLPVLVVQHMPPVFTRLLSQRLDASVPLQVIESVEETPVRRGQVVLAAGGSHLVVEPTVSGTRSRPAQGPAVNGCIPSVDVLFSSLVDVYGSGVLAVVLTGMGQDGMRGCGRIREAGGQVLVQDERTSVVWGMPGAVATAGLADAVLPLGDIASEIRIRVRAAAAGTAGERAAARLGTAVGE